MQTLKESRIFVLLALLLLLGGCAAQRESMSNYFSDAAVTARVKKAIYNEPSLKVSEISVSTEDGIVELKGKLKNHGMVVKAVRVTRKVEGVKGVKNELEVDKGRGSEKAHGRGSRETASS